LDYNQSNTVVLPLFKFLRNPQKEEFIEFEIKTTKARIEKTEQRTETKIRINLSWKIEFFSIFKNAIFLI